VCSAAAALSPDPAPIEARRHPCEWCETGQRRQLLRPYIAAFLTVRRRDPQNPGSPERGSQRRCNAEVVLGPEAERSKFCETRTAAALVEASWPLIRLGGALMTHMKGAKSAQGILDYDDLISAASHLLRHPALRHGCCSSSTAASTIF